MESQRLHGAGVGRLGNDQDRLPVPDSPQPDHAIDIAGGSHHGTVGRESGCGHFSLLPFQDGLDLAGSGFPDAQAIVVATAGQQSAIGTAGQNIHRRIFRHRGKLLSGLRPFGLSSRQPFSGFGIPDAQPRSPASAGQARTVRGDCNLGP